MARAVCRAICLLLLAWFAMGVRTARAQSSALAQKLFDEARSLCEVKRFDEAIPMFKESQRIEPALGTLMNLGMCEVDAGRLASAWGTFHLLRDDATRSARSDRDGYIQVATERIAELEPKLSRIRFRVDPTEGVKSITIGGQELRPAAFSSALPLDPGNWVAIVVAEKGRFEQAIVIPSQPGEHVIELRRPPGTAPPMLADTPTSTSGVDGRLVGGVTALGLGAVAAGLGTFFSVRALSLKGDSEEHCEGLVCDAEGLAAYEDARTHAHGATASFVISGVGVATGVSLLIWVATDQPAGTATVVGRF